MLLDPTHFRVIFIGEMTHSLKCDFFYKYRYYIWTALMANISIRKRRNLLRISSEKTSSLIRFRATRRFKRHRRRKQVLQTSFDDILVACETRYCVMHKHNFSQTIHETALALSREVIEIRENSSRIHELSCIGR